MNNMKIAEGLNYKIILTNGFQYTGKCKAQDEQFISILDKQNKILWINKQQISIIEVLV